MNMPMQPKGYRWTSRIRIGSWPLIAIAVGADPERGQMRGHARGVIALGDIATGIIAVGGVAWGGLVLGGLAIGVIPIGGFAMGGLVLGGAAIGAVAVGGLAVGYYALGGAAYGRYVFAAMHQDPEAVEFFQTFAPWLLP